MLQVVVGGDSRRNNSDSPSNLGVRILAPRSPRFILNN
jgi:hypothetical protein